MTFFLFPFHKKREINSCLPPWVKEEEKCSSSLSFHQDLFSLSWEDRGEVLFFLRRIGGLSPPSQEQSLFVFFVQVFPLERRRNMRVPLVCLAF